MIGTAYLDESTDATNQIAFVAAGFFCLDPEWKKLRKQWRKVLKPHGIDYFRSYDCRTLKGEFAKLKDKWGQDKARIVAEKIRKNLEDVIESCPLMLGAGFGINMKDFREVDAMAIAQSNRQWMRECHDYQTCAYRSMFNMLGHMLIVELSNLGNNYIAFVCDESGHDAKIRRGYERMKQKFEILKDRFVGFATLDDKKTPELQMADLMADVAREMITSHLANGGAEAPPFSLKDSVFRVQTWNKSGMLKLLRGEAAGA